MRKLPSLFALGFAHARHLLPNPQRTINPTKRNSSEINQWNAQVAQRKADKQAKVNERKK